MEHILAIAFKSTFPHIWAHQSLLRCRYAFYIQYFLQRTKQKLQCKDFLSGNIQAVKYPKRVLNVIIFVNNFYFIILANTKEAATRLQILVKKSCCRTSDLITKVLSISNTDGLISVTFFTFHHFIFFQSLVLDSRA